MARRFSSALNSDMRVTVPCWTWLSLPSPALATSNTFRMRPLVLFFLLM